MRMFTIEVDFLAEDSGHANAVLGRVVEALSHEQTVLSVGNLIDVTEHATEEEQLTEDEVDQLLMQRDVYFINRIRYLQGKRATIRE